jgi:PAS domain S-box-containing protein
MVSNERSIRERKGQSEPRLADRDSLLLQALILVVSVAMAAGWHLHQKEHVTTMRDAVREQNRLRLQGTADHVEDYFRQVYTNLTYFSLDPDVQAMVHGTHLHLQAFFDHEWEDLQFGEIYVADRDFDGSTRPLLTFEHGREQGSADDIHNPEREEEEYQVLIEHIRRFAGDPELQELVSREIKLCLPVHGKPDEQAVGVVLSVPVRQQGRFQGIVSAMVPSARIIAELGTCRPGSIVMLANQGCEVFGCASCPEESNLWLGEQLQAVGLDGFFSTATQGRRFGRMSTLWVPIQIIAGESWWLVLRYDEEAYLGESGLDRHSWLLTAGILFSGLMLVLVVRTSRQRATAEVERRRADEAKHRSETLHDNVVESIQEGIFVLDKRLRCRVWNSAMEKIFMVPREEILGVAHEDWPILPACSRQEMEEMLHLTLEGQTARRDEVCYQLADGIERLTTELYHPLLTSSGEIDGVVGVVRDITHERQLEIQLRQSQKIEAIGTLAGGVAHDFNNILQAIIASTDLVDLEVEEDSFAHQLLEEIQEAANRATNLVQQILTFSRRGEQHPVPVDVGAVATETLQLLRHTQPASVELRESVASQVGTVIADPTQLQQILINLCTNAYQALADCGGMVEVEVKRIESTPELSQSIPKLRASASYIRLSVRDNGPGMEQQVIDRIFEPYFSTRQTGGGSGLGLAVVHGIVSGLNGAISVSSKPGQGAVFVVYLPLHGETEAQRTESLAAPPRGDEHLLFVDDEEPVVRIGERMLASLGYQVTAATSSIEALRLFRADPNSFDMVITDQTMPGLTGAALARELKAVRADIPVILCTGYTDSVDQESGRLLGVEAFLAKPINRATIAEAIRAALDDERGSRLAR